MNDGRPSNRATHAPAATVDEQPVIRTLRDWLMEKLISAFWAFLAFLVILYGNGEHDLVTLVLFTSQCSWPFVVVGCACWAINGILFLYVCGWLQAVKGVKQPLDKVPWAMQLGSACFATAFVSVTLGIWPVFGFLSPVIVVIVTYGTIMSLHFLPHLGLLQPSFKEPLTSVFHSKED